MKLMRMILNGMILLFISKQTLKPKCHLLISSLVKAVFSLIFRINFRSLCSSRFSCNFEALTPIFSACFVSARAQLCEIYKKPFSCFFCCLKSFFFNQTEATARLSRHMVLRMTDLCRY